LSRAWRPALFFREHLFRDDRKRGGIGNTIVGLFVLGVLNNGLDHVNIDSFLKILIRGLILPAALIINVYAQRLRERAVEWPRHRE
jgi:hypothetical protein